MKKIKRININLISTEQSGEKIAEQVGNYLDEYMDEQEETTPTNGWLLGFRLVIKPISFLEAKITHWWWGLQKWTIHHWRKEKRR